MLRINAVHRTRLADQPTSGTLGALPTRGPALVFVLVLLALMTACSEVRNGTGIISQRIGEIVHDPGRTEVDLGSLTTFGWKYFYVFRPGSHVFMIFGLRGQLTHVELHAIENGRFELNFQGDAYPRSASIFRIRRNARGADKARE